MHYQLEKTDMNSQPILPFEDWTLPQLIVATPILL